MVDGGCSSRHSDDDSFNATTFAPFCYIHLLPYAGQRVRWSPATVHIPLQWQCMYRRGVARQPVDFEIGTVYTETDADATVRISATEAVPRTFIARIALERPKLEVELEVWMVQPGNRAVVRKLLVVANTATPVTTTTLRRVLVDPLLRAAVQAAAVPVTPRPDAHPLAFQVPGQQGTAYVGPPPPRTDRGRRDTADANAETAARIYKQAVMLGSRTPAKDVVAAMAPVSRAQVARYLRRAREELKILAPRGSSSAQDSD